jgi:FKBP-type peptidyl-prolyl cis-trans isomerase FkpA
VPIDGWKNASLDSSVELIIRPDHEILFAHAVPFRRPEHSAADRGAALRKRGAGPVVANDSIIPLPLTPIVPAAQRSCAAKTASGLGYTMLRQGQGAKPAADDTVLVNYIGYLAATGAAFDQGMHSPLPVNQVIPGFSQGLQMAARNGIVRLCIPAALGYGAQESGPIPANSDLVFQVEVIDFKSAAEIEAMRKAQSSEPAPQQNIIGKPQN